jgi:HEAT repeat protein
VKRWRLIRPAIFLFLLPALLLVNPKGRAELGILHRGERFLGGRAVSIWGRALRQRQPGVVSYLGELREGAEPLVPTLIELLHDADPRVRSDAADILGSIGPGSRPAVPALVERLREDSDPRVRAQAALALGALGPDAQEAVPALTEALNDTATTGGSEEVSDAAARALEQIQSARPVGPSNEWPVLLKATLGVLALTLAVLAALGSYVAAGLLRGEHLYLGLPSRYWAGAVRRWAEGPDLARARFAAVRRYLGLDSLPAVLRGDPAATFVLMDLLRDTDREVRVAAFRALDVLDPQRRFARETRLRVWWQDDPSCVPSSETAHGG